MPSTSVIYYDGLISLPRAAQMRPVDNTAVMIEYQDQGKDVIQRIEYADMTFIGALAQHCPVIEVKNDARIEFLDPQTPDWFVLSKQQFQQGIWKLERAPALIAFSVVFMLVFGYVVVKWGVPFTANYVAEQLPAKTLNTLGDQAEKYVFELTAESKLPQGQQNSIRQQYRKYIADDQPAKLLFRQGTQLGANALALPNHTIIVTDELVEMAHSDQEILGVLAHEQGHLIERHSLKSALASLGISILYVGITGDSSDLVSTLPIAMTSAGYSREFESQADLYALNLMHKQNLEVSHFANMLERLSGDEEPQDNAVFDFFSSHPATAERVRMVREFEVQHSKQP